MITTARTTDPETSHEAADGNDVTGSKMVVFTILALFGPLDDFQIEAKHRASGWHRQYSPSRLRTARSALVDDEVVKFTGYFHRSPSQRRTRVWQVKP